jgi:acyl carrier protein
MTISSRTPEGLPHQCPICGKIAALEPCYPGGDSVCPSCGHLLWSIRDRLASNLCANLGVNLDQINFETTLRDELGVDSLELVEFTIELEEEFDVTVPDEVAENFRTVGDVIEYLSRR